VIVADTRDDALERAAGFGATRVVNVIREPLAEVVARLTGGRGADVAFEVTGQQRPLTLLGEVTRMSGTVVIVGYHQDGIREIPLGSWNWNAFRTVNAHFREPGAILRGMERGMRLMASERLTVGSLVTHCFSLHEIGRAFCTAVDKPERRSPRSRQMPSPRWWHSQLAESLDARDLRGPSGWLIHARHHDPGDLACNPRGAYKRGSAACRHRLRAVLHG
jgi:hypothetical protein